MKNIRKVLAGVSALAMALSVTACGGGTESSGGGNSGGGAGGADNTAAETSATTTALTVAVNTETLAEEEQKTLDDVASSELQDIELENKTIKWLAHYDLNPSTSGQSESVALNMFKSKYGGQIEWYPTTWENRYADLSTYVLGGDGIDFFPCDTAALPKGVVSGMFQPVDSYIDMDAPLWKDMKSAMSIYNFNGKHYCLVNSVSAEQVVVYNKQTIEENGFDDPWELYEDGEWNWDTFKDMLENYVDPDSDHYGLDGYWAEKALYLSAGVPGIESVNGTLTSNLMDATFEKAMNYGYELYSKGLIIDRSIFDWNEQPAFMGNGQELFYIIGAWGVNTDPATWSTKIPPENLGIAPVPSPAGSDPFQSATLDGWVICKGAANPQGVAMFAECTRLAGTNDEAIAIGDQKLRDDAHWSDELIAHNKEINELAQKYPVVDLSTGVSNDVAQLTTDGGDGNGFRGAFHGVEWSTVRDEISEVVQVFMDEVDTKIKEME